MKHSLLLLVAVLLIPALTPTEVQAGKAYHSSQKCLPGSVKATLKKMRGKFGPYSVISTYRRNARIKGTNRRSKHASCRAIDFKIKNRYKVYRWLKANHSGGVGVYRGKCAHIHIDNGSRRRWNRSSCR